MKNKTDTIVYQNNKNILLEDEPISLLLNINDGTLSRFDAWSILQQIHFGTYNCNLPQYGILTVFSLANDKKEFTRMFEQGCEMLKANGVCSEEQEQKSFDEIRNRLYNAMTKTELSVKQVNKTKPSKKISAKKKNNKNNKKNN